MQWEKQFSFTFEIRYLALVMLDCWVRAVVMRDFSSVCCEGEGCWEVGIVGWAREERSVLEVLEELEEEESLEPPKPKTMMVVRWWDLVVQVVSCCGDPVGAQLRGFEKCGWVGWLWVEESGAVMQMNLLEMMC